MRAARWTAAAITAAAIGALPAAAAGASLPGALTPVPGTGGCANLTGGSGCAASAGMNGARNVAISPDGRNVYVSTSGADDTLLTFDRNAVTGAVTQKAGAQGCIQDTAAAVQLANCGDAIALDDSRDLEVSPDGRNVYVASRLSNAIAVFDRDATTGALTQKAGTLGCVRSTSFAANGCSGARILAEPFTLVVSPDGSTVHVNSFSQDGIATLKREADGSLTSIAGADGCIVETVAATGCRDGSGLVDPRGLAISPDGATVYNAAIGGGAGAVTVFDRSPATGGLTQKAGQDGCLSETGNAGACRASALLQFFSSNGFGQVAVAPNGRTVWAGSQVNGGAVAGLPRETATGRIGATPSTGELCMTGSRPADIDATTPSPAEACTDGVGLNGIFELALSPDGRSLYVNSGAGGGLGSIDIDPATGRLSQRPGLGCTSPGGTFLNELCTPSHPSMASGATQIVVSPDNRHVYAAGSVDGLFAFARDLPPSCRDDARVIQVGGAAPMTLSCTDPNGDAVAFGVASQPSSGVLLAANFGPTGGLTYVPNPGFTGIDQFTFKATTANGGESDAARVLVLVQPPQAGPQGAQGVPGPQGAKGDPAFKLQAAFISEAVKAATGRAVSLRYLSTVAAAATLDIRRGTRRIARVTSRAKAGRNRITWNGKEGRKAARAGRYTLTLTLRAGGQTATDRVAATLTPARRR